MGLFKASALVNDEPVEFQFWSRAQVNSAQNIIDACNTYNKNRDVLGTIQILKVKKIPYAEMEVKHAERSVEEVSEATNETAERSE